jgi:hypothetical protein
MKYSPSPMGSDGAGPSQSTAVHWELRIVMNGKENCWCIRIRLRYIPLTQIDAISLAAFDDEIDLLLRRSDTLSMCWAETRQSICTSRTLVFVRSNCMEAQCDGEQPASRRLVPAHKSGRERVSESKRRKSIGFTEQSTTDSRGFIVDENII